MKIYFLSSQPAALTLNGVFYGVTDTFERSAEIALSDNVYARFSPQGRGALGFFINEELLTSPPLGFEVYLLKEGVAVYARDFPPLDLTLRPIAQKREGELLVTVYAQGEIQLNVQEGESFFNTTLPPSFSSCSIELVHGIIALKGENTLGIFTKTCIPLLIENVLAYEWTEEGLNATLPLADSLQRVADCCWKVTKNECLLTGFTLRQPQTHPPLDEGLLAYAFFESVLLKGDAREALCEDLQEEYEEIVRFLGDFISVTLTNEPNVCGLVRKKRERLFVVDYFSVTIKEGKIVDVQG